MFHIRVPNCAGATRTNTWADIGCSPCVTLKSGGTVYQRRVAADADDHALQTHDIADAAGGERSDRIDQLAGMRNVDDGRKEQDFRFDFGPFGASVDRDAIEPACGLDEDRPDGAVPRAFCPTATIAAV